MEGKKESILQELVLDQDKVTDELLKDQLAPHVGLSSTEDKIVPKPSFMRLPQPKKILLYLLARHAMVRLGIPGASYAAQTEKVAEGCLVHPKSCREGLSRLKAAGMVTRAEDGWSIPAHSLFRVATELHKGRQGQK